MNIVFMGTPDFAVGSLTAISKKHNVIGVFTQPDKLVGRKQILTPPAVKLKAMELNIPVYQPNTLRDGSALEILKELNPDIIVVVAYGKFLPNEILTLPRFGCVNVHGSILPKLRGASPIQWALVTGERETGVTTQFMAEGMDTGDIIETLTVSIEEEDNFRSLHDKLAVAGADIICSTLEKISNGTATRTPQKEADATYAPIIKKEFGLIDFSKTATEIRNLVRAFDPWPSAFTTLGGKRFKVISASVCDQKHEKPNGTLLDGTNEILVAAGNNSVIRFDTVQLEGSKAMSGIEFTRGRVLPKGMIFGE